MNNYDTTMLRTVDSRTGTFRKGNATAGVSYFPNRLTKDLIKKLNEAVNSPLSIDRQVRGADNKNLLLEAKKIVFLQKNGFLLKCAHLGSNQGPKDYYAYGCQDFRAFKSGFIK